jgi:DNA-binding GntR family transcriptional regulator
MLEGIAAELAATRAEPTEIEQLEGYYKDALSAAKEPRGLDHLIESNQQFHLQIARMSHNRELQGLVRGVLERSVRLVYLAAGSSRQVPLDIELLLKPILDAIKARDPIGAHQAVVADISSGQLSALGRDFWGETSYRRPPIVLAKPSVSGKKGS